LASFRAIAAVGRSLERLLGRSFQQLDPVGGNTRAVLVRTEDFGAEDGLIVAPALSIYLYRIDLDRVTRPGWSAAGHVSGRGHITLNLHFLLTPWAPNADHEARILGRALAVLEANPILTGPNLDPVGEFAPGEEIQLVTGEITTEEIMRTFDSLPTDYKLSVPYLARVVRIDTEPLLPDAPAVDVLVGGRPEVP